MAAAVGMGASVFILSDYALNSSNDVLGNSKITAIAFAALPSISAIAMKEFQQKLTNPNVRWYCEVAILGVGLCSLFVWLGAAALCFAPSAGVAASLLASDSSANLSGIVLVITTVICDVAVGCTLLSGAERVLAANEASGETSNPSYLALLRERRDIRRQIEAVQDRAAAAQEYLSSVAAARELTRKNAEADVLRVRELWAETQNAARAYATAVFQSRKEDEP